MGWIARLVERKPPEQRYAISLDELESLLSGPTQAGLDVSTESALRQVTVFACVRLIAESVGMLPLVLYRRLDRGKERATEHPLYTILHDLPNPELTALELYELLTGHLALWGNAYCEIEYDRAGRRRALWPLRPDRMQVDVNERNERVYEYLMPDGRTVALPRYRVWHVRGFGTDAWVGKSPIALAREAIGLALATEQFGATWFGNGSRPGGVLKHPGRLKDDSQKRLKASWEEAHRGLGNANRVAILEEGMEWQQVGIPPEDAQFLQTRQFQDTQICALYRVPPHMIGITERTTSWGSGIGQQTLGYQTFTIQPYLSRLTQSIGRDLLSQAERGTYFAEHVTAALVRNDLQTRYQAYATARQWGWLSINDVRELENLNPITDGDDYMVPLNMAPADRLGELQSAEGLTPQDDGAGEVDDEAQG